MTCPVCRTELRERSIAGIVIDDCPSCGGCWFDGSELEQYRARLSQASARPAHAFVGRDDPGRRACPRCKVLTLINGSVRAQRALLCSNCNGLFMSRGAVEALGPARVASHSTEFDILDVLDAEALIEIVVEITSSVLDS